MENVQAEKSFVPVEIQSWAYMSGDRGTVDKVCATPNKVQLKSKSGA